MNIFILCTGRCGSTTFIRAASHIANFTSAHESRTMFTGRERFAYPKNHIEADNRLSWFLGRLDQCYGAKAYYVHLQRDLKQTAESFQERWDFGIMQAYHSAIIMGKNTQKRHADINYCIDYCETVNSNIALFLRDKPYKMDFKLECADYDWQQFWNWIGAEGSLDASLREWQTMYNARKQTPEQSNRASVEK